MRSAIAILVFAAVTYARQQPPPRDARPAPVVGRGVISGTVLTGDMTPQPVRGAYVRLYGTELLGGRDVITDESGTFRFTGLPPARLTLTATKPAYLTATYGAKRPGGTGGSIALIDGQSMANLTLILHKGAVISGRIVDERGRPVPDVEVYASRLVWVNGQRQPSGSATNDPIKTNDLGVYRLFGLAPGEFVVRASIGSGGNIRRILPGEVDAILKPQFNVPAPLESEATLGFSSIYFPGTPRLENATRLSVGVAEEIGGIDFAVQLVPTARISGTLTGAAIDAGAAVRVMLFGGALGLTGRQVDTVGPAGQARPFQFVGIAPGHYVLAARAPNTAGASTLASMEFDLDGRNLDNLELVLQPGLTISGHLVLDKTVQGTSPSDWQVNALPMSDSQASRSDGPAAVAADGTFTIRGLLPGRYLISAYAKTSTIMMANRSTTVKSAMVDGVDGIDLPIEVQPGRDVSDVLVTMTTQRAELSGTLQTATGEPTPDYFVILFPTERALWTNYSRYIRAVRPGSDGMYRLTGLPAGHYLLAALTDVEQGEWLNPEFLATLVAGAAKVELAEGEKKVQDIQIRR